MNRQVTGIVDLPIKRMEEDRLNMRAFELALSEFVRHTDTPMTIAIQGEWGSGKTSLMNRLSQELCEPSDSPFYGIWLNTWHYALVNQDVEILVEIIRSLIEEVAKITRAEHPERLKRFLSDVYDVSRVLFRGVSKVAVKTAISTVSDDAADHAEEILFAGRSGGGSNLEDLRQTLGTLINELVQKNEEEGIGKRTFLFFIDDLDRIEPSVAVQILELLKNIFEIEHCVFILAIDYEVVVNGLRPKFGAPDANNEREFRSFFDKIIQLPFRMPVQSFAIDDFLTDALLSIGVITEEESGDDEFIQALSELARLSVGTNPRSLKRLANSLSFINLLTRANSGRGEGEMDSLRKQISFGLVCLQIAFPPIYNLLAANTDYLHWTAAFARAQQADGASLKNQDDLHRYAGLGAEWQKIVFVACSKSTYLSKHTHNVIRMLVRLEEIAREGGSDVTELISEIFEVSSVTNVKTEIRPKLDINHVRVLHALNEKLLPLLKGKLRPPFNIAERSGRMVAKVTYKFQEKKGDHWISVHVGVKHNNLLLTVGNQVGLFPVGEDEEGGLAALGKRGKLEYFHQIHSGFTDLEDQYPAFTLVRKADMGLEVKRGIQMCEVQFQTYVEAVEYLYTARFLDTLSDLIMDFMTRSDRMSGGDWR